MHSKVTTAEKICYSLSALGGNIPSYILVGYITLFATDIMGVSASAIGWILLICCIVDAFTDLFITNLADRPHSRWGKYRPWLLFSGIPMVLTMILLFWYPDFLHTVSGKILWLFFGYFLFSPVFLTSYICPEYVMLSVMTGSDSERVSLGAARSVGENMSDLFVNSFFMTAVLFFGGGNYRNIQGWRMTVSLFGAFCLFACIAGFAGTRERITISNVDADGVRLTLREKLYIVLGDPAYRKVLLLNALSILPTMETILVSYFCIYVLGHEEWISVLAATSSISAILTVLVLPRLRRYLDIQRLISVGSILLIVASILCIFADSLPLSMILCIFKGSRYGLSISCIGIL